jgi:hypothetical protein
MRNIFLCLLLANLGYFTYQQLQPPLAKAPRVTQSHLTGVSGIQLTREVKRTSVRNRQLSQVVNNAVYEPPVATALGAASDAAAVGGVTVPAEPGQVSPAELQCAALGPLADLFAGQNLVEKLRAFELDVVLQAIDENTGGSDFRVVIPPAKTLQDAFRKVRELKSGDIDSYVISQGQDALGISLGLFSSRGAAEVAQSRFSADGYETQVREITHLQRNFWVFAAKAGSSLEIDPVLWASILEDFPEIQQIKRRCPENKLGVV